MVRFNSVVDAITLMRREDGSRLIPIRRYYIDKVARLGAGYRVSIPDVGKGLGKCPLHEDNTPSFGILNGDDGRERYSCFGCQSFGNVVDLHQRVEKIFRRRTVSKDVAAYELLDMYQIDRVMIDNLVGTRSGRAERVSGEETKLQRRSRLARELRESFTDEDYRKAVVEGVLDGRPLEYFNTLMHIRTSTMSRGE